RRQQIAFRINQTIGICVRRDSVSASHGGPQSRAPPFAVNLLIAERQQAQRNFRARGVESLTNESPALVAHADNRAARDLFSVAHIAAINPQVSGACTLRSALCDNSALFHCGY